MTLIMLWRFFSHCYTLQNIRKTSVSFRTKRALVVAKRVLRKEYWFVLPGRLSRDVQFSPSSSISCPAQSDLLINKHVTGDTQKDESSSSADLVKAETQTWHSRFISEAMVISWEIWWRSSTYLSVSFSHTKQLWTQPVYQHVNRAKSTGKGKWFYTQTNSPSVGIH